VDFFVMEVLLNEKKSIRRSPAIFSGLRIDLLSLLPVLPPSPPPFPRPHFRLFFVALAHLHLLFTPPRPSPLERLILEPPLSFFPQIAACYASAVLPP